MGPSLITEKEMNQERELESMECTMGESSGGSEFESMECNMGESSDPTLLGDLEYSYRTYVSQGRKDDAVNMLQAIETCNPERANSLAKEAATDAADGEIDSLAGPIPKKSDAEAQDNADNGNDTQSSPKSQDISDDDGMVRKDVVVKGFQLRTLDLPPIPHGADGSQYPIGDKYLFKCDKCGRQERAKSAFARHMRTVHQRYAKIPVDSKHYNKNSEYWGFLITKVDGNKLEWTGRKVPGDENSERTGKMVYEENGRSKRGPSKRPAEASGVEEQPAAKQAKKEHPKQAKADARAIPQPAKPDTKGKGAVKEGNDVDEDAMDISGLSITNAAAEGDDVKSDEMEVEDDYIYEEEDNFDAMLAAGKVWPRVGLD